MLWIFIIIKLDSKVVRVFATKEQLLNARESLERTSDRTTSRPHLHTRTFFWSVRISNLYENILKIFDRPSVVDSLLLIGLNPICSGG